MCLGIPGRIVEVYPEDGLTMARVAFDGIVKKVCIDHVADAKPGEYVLVHVGFALAKIDEEEARRVFEFLGMNGQLDELAEEEPS